MNLYTARAAFKRLKYYDEHVSFGADGSELYNWRLIFDEISSGRKLSLPEDLTFICKKLKFERLGEYDWLKSDFVLPLVSKKFVKVLKAHLEQEFELFPIVIKSSKGQENNDYFAFYLKDYFDCLDKESSIPRAMPDGKLHYDYSHCKIRSTLDYPFIFKIKGVSTPFMHFTTDTGITLLNKYGLENIGVKNARKET